MLLLVSYFNFNFPEFTGYFFKNRRFCYLLIYRSTRKYVNWNIYKFLSQASRPKSYNKYVIYFAVSGGHYNKNVQSKIEVFAY